MNDPATFVDVLENGRKNIYEKIKIMYSPFGLEIFFNTLGELERMVMKLIKVVI